jgi:hypothetical protein
MEEDKKQSGRPMGRRHQDDVRSKIKASQIINRFWEVFEGNLELTNQQVNIGKVLFYKVLPDLKAIELSGDADAPVVLKVITGIPSKFSDD